MAEQFTTSRISTHECKLSDSRLNRAQFMISSKYDNTLIFNVLSVFYKVNASSEITLSTNKYKTAISLCMFRKPMMIV
jgi:hypothetical protein